MTEVPPSMPIGWVYTEVPQNPEPHLAQDPRNPTPQSAPLGFEPCLVTSPVRQSADLNNVQREPEPMRAAHAPHTSWNTVKTWFTDAPATLREARHSNDNTRFFVTKYFVCVTVSCVWFLSILVFIFIIFFIL